MHRRHCTTSLSPFRLISSSSILDSFYVIKPNERKNWHPAVARLDLNEFMDAIMRAGKEQLMESK